MEIGLASEELRPSHTADGSAQGLVLSKDNVNADTVCIGCHCRSELSPT